MVQVRSTQMQALDAVREIQESSNECKEILEGIGVAAYIGLEQAERLVVLLRRIQKQTIRALTLAEMQEAESEQTKR